MVLVAPLADNAVALESSVLHQGLAGHRNALAPLIGAFAVVGFPPLLLASGAASAQRGVLESAGGRITSYLVLHFFCRASK
mmetsp:Transcript_124794/g.285923  ORF Transcript_124794/g.285923 Transcript_124794/m.285923 type:complete len:81 (+) Transcript_124794:514-756(+)